MPRLTTTPPRYRRHRSSGQAVVTFNGRDFYLGVHGTKASKQEYDRLVSLWLAGGKTLASIDKRHSITVAELAAAFWAHAKCYYVRPNGRPTQELANYKRVLKPLKEMFAASPVCEFGPLRLVAIRDRLVADGLARPTVNQHIIRLRNVFRWGVANELVPAEIHQALLAVTGLRRGRTIARETAPVRPVSDEIVEMTLIHLPVVVADMVRLQRLTGARPEEICLLRPMDVDRSKDVWRYQPAHHKTAHHGHQRIIFLGPKAQQVLRPYLLRHGERYCFSPHESEVKRRAQLRDERVTPLGAGNRPGTNVKRRPKKRPLERYTTDSYRRAIYRACEIAFAMPANLRYPHRIKKPNGEPLTGEERAELQQQANAWRKLHCWSPNQLRHSAATEIRQKFGLESAQVALGHSAADVTQIYAERDWGRAEQVMRQIG